MLCRNCGARLFVMGHFELGKYAVGRRLKCKKCGMYYYTEERIVSERQGKIGEYKVWHPVKGGETE